MIESCIDKGKSREITSLQEKKKIVLWEDMNLRAMNSLYHEMGNGLFQEKSTPPADGRHVFLLLAPPP